MIRELTEAKTYNPYSGSSGLYVSRIPDEFSIIKLVNFVHENGLAELTEYDISELHCTIIYSPESTVPRENDLNVNALPVAARVISFEAWPGHDDDGYLVAVL